MLSDNLFSLDVCIFNAIDIRNIQYDQNFFELSNQITYQKQQKNHTNPVVSNNVFYWNTYSHPVTISDQFQKPSLCACHAWCAYRTIIRVPWPHDPSPLRSTILWFLYSPPRLQSFVKLVDEYSWWRHQMETFSTSLGLCAGNSPVTGEFSSQRPMTQSFDVFIDLGLNKRSSKHVWGLRHNPTHYDVIVMLMNGKSNFFCQICNKIYLLHRDCWLHYVRYSYFMPFFHTFP